MPSLLTKETESGGKGRFQTTPEKVPGESLQRAEEIVEGFRGLGVKDEQLERVGKTSEEGEEIEAEEGEVIGRSEALPLVARSMDPKVGESKNAEGRSRS